VVKVFETQPQKTQRGTGEIQEQSWQKKRHKELAL
jgi:hypothetical protein